MEDVSALTIQNVQVALAVCEGQQGPLKTIGSEVGKVMLLGVAFVGFSFLTYFFVSIVLTGDAVIDGELLVVHSEHHYLDEIRIFFLVGSYKNVIEFELVHLNHSFEGNLEIKPIGMHQPVPLIVVSGDHHVEASALQVLLDEDYVEVLFDVLHLLLVVLLNILDFGC